MKFGVQCCASVFPNSWRDDIDDRSLATLQLVCGIGDLLEGRRFVQLFFHRLLRDLLDRRVVDGAIGAEEGLEMFCSAVQDGRLICEQCLAVYAAQGANHLWCDRRDIDCL